MRIKFLGSGSAFVLGTENFQSNILLTKNVENLELHPASQFGETLYKSNKDVKHLLYDAGTSIADALAFSNLEPKDLDSIYISHLHADHAGGIEYLGFKTYFETYPKPFGSQRPNLIGHSSVLINGWENTWKGGLQSIQNKTNTLETYFNTTYLENNNSFDFYGTEIKPIQMYHVKDDRSINPSFGLMFEENGVKCFISGDTQFTPGQLIVEYNESDVIFQDCEFADYPGSVHAQFHQLKELNKEVKNKMWLYHYMLKGKTFEELEKEVLEAGFAGLVKRGQEFFTESM